MDFKEKIRVIEGFPHAGISFKDITTLLKDGQAYRALIDELGTALSGLRIDAIMGPEARGFVIAAPLAYALGVGFIPVRKKGKLPAPTRRIHYGLEYGEDALEIHVDAVTPGMNIVIADDLLATGGTALAAIKLVEELGGRISCACFAIELVSLGGREKLAGYNVKTIMQYS